MLALALVLALIAFIDAGAAWASTGPPERAQAARACGSIQGGFAVTIVKGKVRCHAARRVLKAFFWGKGTKHGHGPESNLYWTLYGWRCAHAAGGGGCIRHGTTYRDARDYIIAQI